MMVNGLAYVGIMVVFCLIFVGLIRGLVFIKEKRHSSQIEKYRKIAGERYLEWVDVSESYSCGLTLAEHVSPTLRKAKREFNEALTKLEELGVPVMNMKL